MAADTPTMDRLHEEMQAAEETRHPVPLRDLAVMIDLALAATVAATALGGVLPEVGPPTITSVDT